MSLFKKLHLVASSSCFQKHAFSRLLSSTSTIQDIPNLFLTPEKTSVIHHTPSVSEAILNEEKIQLPVLDLNGVDTGEKLSVDKSVFGTPLRKDILQRVVKWQLAKRRAGTAKTKTRSEVSGSGKKAWAQKGSGRARVGNIRPPQWRGGYRCHGPQVRDFGFNLPKKVRTMGLRVALSAKAREGRLAIVKDFSSDSPKTKEMRALLKKNGWMNSLFVDNQFDKNFSLSCRNIPNIDILPECGANVYSILKRDTLILSIDAVKSLEKRLMTT